MAIPAHRGPAAHEHVSLGVAVDGVGWHPGAWRTDPDGTARLFDPEYWVETALAAERGDLDYLAFEDTFGLQREGAAAPRTDRVRGRLDSVLVASFVAPRTSRIGLIPAVVVTHTEPFHAAKAIATLDYTSGGRAGVRLRVGASDADARLVGRREFPEITPANLDEPGVRAVLDDAFAEADDYAEVLRRLWDSWEDDAEIRDVAAGRFVDREKLHYVDFEGRWFSVKGPLTVPRPPQGQPLVAVLGHGALPYRLGVSQADLLWVTPRDAGDARRIVTEVRELERASGRGETPLRVVGDVVVVLEDTGAEATARLERLDALAAEPLDSDAHVHVGTLETLGDLVEEWVTAGLDGVRFRPASTLLDLPRLTGGVAPELRRRGLARTGDSTDSAHTLRGRLGLARPASRYATTEAR